MVKFNIGLKMSEMKSSVQLQTFHYFMTTKTIGKMMNTTTNKINKESKTTMNSKEKHKH
jgi:hypothetical protein